MPRFGDTKVALFSMIGQSIDGRRARLDGRNHPGAGGADAAASSQQGRAGGLRSGENPFLAGLRDRFAETTGNKTQKQRARAGERGLTADFGLFWGFRAGRHSGGGGKKGILGELFRGKRA